MFLALASGKTSGLSNFVPGNLNVEDNFDYTTRCAKYRSTNLILKCYVKTFVLVLYAQIAEERWKNIAQVSEIWFFPRTLYKEAE